MNEYNNLKDELTSTGSAVIGKSFTIDTTPDQSVEGLKNQLAWAMANIESWAKRWDEASKYLQASIDREEWDNDELAEPFWEELAEMFNLDLKRTKEVEFKVTLTYYGSARVPVDCDIESDIEIEGVPNELEFMLNGELLDDQTCNWDEQVIETM